jgi:hypothetical protein
MQKCGDVQNGSDVEAVDEVKVLAGWITTSVDGVCLDRAKVNWRDVHAQSSGERGNAESWVQVLLSDHFGGRVVLFRPCFLVLARVLTKRERDTPLTSFTWLATGLRSDSSRASILKVCGVEMSRGVEVVVGMLVVGKRICRVTVGFQTNRVNV